MDLEILATNLFGNTLKEYLFFVAIILIGLIFKKLLSKYLSNLLYKIIGEKGNNVGIDKFDELLTKPIGFFIMLCVFYFGFNYLKFPSFIDENFQNIFSKLFTLIFIYAVFKIFLKVIDYIGLILKQRAALTENKMDDQLIPFATEIGRIIVVIFALFFVLGNVFGINITALATGLGIGGIAIAMASKESLENLLGSFTIFFDRPFTVGDVVKANILASNALKVWKGEVINIGSGINISINDVANMISDVFAYKEALKEPFANLASVEKAKKLLDWEPEMNLKSWIEKYKNE